MSSFLHILSLGTCPPGKDPVQCLVNPCDVTTCDKFPNAECIFDNCGGCFARFFVNNREVTDECISGKFSYVIVQKQCLWAHHVHNIR